MRDFYRRHLPHYQPPDGVFSVTFRLVDSLPQSVIQALVEEQEINERWLQGIPHGGNKKACFSQSREQYAYRFDDALHTCTGGHRWLARNEIAQLVMDAFIYADSHGCKLLADCIM
jgi:hypothetical protein